MMETSMTPALPGRNVPPLTGRTQWASGRYNGTNLTGRKGSGKSSLAADIAFSDYVRDGGIGQILLDPIGVGLIDVFLWRLWRFLRKVPPSQQPRFLERVKYINVAANDYISPFPLLYKHGSERSLLDVAERYLQTILLTSPWLQHAQVQGWPPLHYIGAQTAVVLAALDLPLTIAFDLLRRPEAWRQAGRFAEAVRRYPESAPAVAFFLDEYIPASQANRRRLLNPYFDKLFVFQLDPHLRAMFGAPGTAGIDWEEVERKKQTVLIDCRGETNQEMKRFKLLWILSGIFEFIKLRGRKDTPFGLILDEFSAFCAHMPTGDNPLVGLLEEFINIYQRNHHIFFTCSYQSVFQIPEQLRNSLLGLGNLVVGGCPTMVEARLMADLVFDRDPNRVQHYRNIWASDYLPRLGTTHFVIDREPKYLGLDAQLELNAQRLYHQDLFEFMLRPSLHEGAVAQAAIPISIGHLLQDPETGAFSFPDQAIVAKFRSLLAAHSGIPIQTLLAEHDALFPSDTQQAVPRPKQPGTAPASPQPPAEKAVTAHPPLPPRRQRLTPRTG
jgi:hypothetical protein